MPGSHGESVAPPRQADRRSGSHIAGRWRNMGWLVRPTTEEEDGKKIPRSEGRDLEMGLAPLVDALVLDGCCARWS
jgi:hypothetical protein